MNPPQKITPPAARGPPQGCKERAVPMPKLLGTRCNLIFVAHTRGSKKKLSGDSSPQTVLAPPFSVPWRRPDFYTLIPPRHQIKVAAAGTWPEPWRPFWPQSPSPCCESRDAPRGPSKPRASSGPAPSPPPRLSAGIEGSGLKQRPGRGSCFLFTFGPRGVVF